MDPVFETYLQRFLEGRLTDEERTAFRALVDQSPEWNWSRVEELRRLHLVEQYEEGLLAEPERRAVERQFAEDATWREKRDQYRQARRALDIDRQKRQLDKLKGIVAQPPEDRRKNRRWRIWPPLLLLLVALVYFWPERGPKPKVDDAPAELAPTEPPADEPAEAPDPATEPPGRPAPPSDQAPETPPGLRPVAMNLLREQSDPELRPALSFLKGEPAIDSLIQRSARAYTAGRFPEVTRLLTPLTDTLRQRENTQALLALGLARFYQGDYREAKTVLSALLRLPNSLAHDEARWFLTLAHLQTNDTAAARRLLTDMLGRASHAHYHEAEELSKALDN